MDRKFSILIVDDLPAMIKLLESSLRRQGQTVFKAESGAEAIEAFRNYRPDAVICDLGMPEMDGWEVAASINDISAEMGVPKPVFVLLTGWGGQVDSDGESQSRGVDVIVEKPVQIDSILTTIEDLWTGKHARVPGTA